MDGLTDGRKNGRHVTNVTVCGIRMRTSDKN